MSDRTDQTTKWLSVRDTIAGALEIVCSDGNSNPSVVADLVIRALDRQGFTIMGKSNLDAGLEHTA